MIVRSLDGNQDWTFGKGIQNYLSNNNAVAQSISTRLNSFLGDCFFDQGAGVNWWFYLGGKNQLSLNLSVSAVILNTENVLSLVQLSVILNSQRALTISYTATTTYSTVQGQVAIAVPVG